MKIIWVPANKSNYTEGRQGKKINKIVMHWIVGSLESAGKTFQDGRRNASAHYGVGDGEIHQFVSDQNTAWHATDWDTNLESIGIEHEGGWELDDGSRKKPTRATHETSAKLIAHLSGEYNIPLDREHILKHNEIAPTQCPGSLDIDLIIKLAKEELNKSKGYFNFDVTKKMPKGALEEAGTNWSGEESIIYKWWVSDDAALDTVGERVNSTWELLESARDEFSNIDDRHADELEKQALKHKQELLEQKEDFQETLRERNKEIERLKQLSLETLTLSDFIRWLSIKFFKRNGKTH